MKLLLLCIISIILARSYLTAYPLDDVIRGHTWKALDITSKSVYIKGVEDSIILLGSANPKTKLLSAYDSILSQDMEHIEVQLNKFYSDEDNINISVVDALLIIADSIKGMPSGKLDSLLSAFRRQALKETQHNK
jgi:hypothetical protein